MLARRTERRSVQKIPDKCIVIGGDFRRLFAGREGRQEAALPLPRGERSPRVVAIEGPAPEHQRDQGGVVRSPGDSFVVGIDQRQGAGVPSTAISHLLAIEAA